jgi:BlaI family penicillinase repressor
MEDLTKAEERVMQIVWKLKKGFVKDIIDAMPDDPKPPYNTISSVVRLLETKGFVGYKAYGKTHEYYPLITKSEYRKASVKKMLSGYFDNSAESLFSFMLKENQLSEDEINKIKQIINKNKPV